MRDLTIKNKTMSSTQLAELLGKEKKEVNRLIRDMFATKIEGGEIPLTLRPNGQVLEYNLPEKESKMLVAKHDIDYLEQVIKFWIEKDSKPTLPQNFSQALRLAADLQEENEKQQKQIEVKNGLIIASNEASIKAGEILVREFVKSVDIVDIGEKKFYQWMRDQGYLLKNSCQPYQPFVNRGLFTWKPSEEQYGGKYRYTLRITPRGKVWLAAKYLAFLDHDLAA